VIASLPDGSGDHVLDIVNVDGSGMTRLDVGRPVHVPAWLPPDGQQIVVQGGRSPRVSSPFRRTG
jgi:hypothetical protein